MKNQEASEGYFINLSNKRTQSNVYGWLVGCLQRIGLWGLELPHKSLGITWTAETHPCNSFQCFLHWYTVFVPAGLYINTLQQMIFRLENIIVFFSMQLWSVCEFHTQSPLKGHHDLLLYGVFWRCRRSMPADFERFLWRQRSSNVYEHKKNCERSLTLPFAASSLVCRHNL